MRNKECIPPFKPDVDNESDVSNIDRSFLNELPVESPIENKLTSSQKAKVYFEHFTYQKEDEYEMLTSS